MLECCCWKGVWVPIVGGWWPLLMLSGCTTEPRCNCVGIPLGCSVLYIDILNYKSLALESPYYTKQSMIVFGDVIGVIRIRIPDRSTVIYTVAQKNCLLREIVTYTIRADCDKFTSYVTVRKYSPSLYIY